ncbi:HAD family hydrolase [Catellatospora tritici]|uniref:HAD family hydrolase n=1 Tax=Catellatospora tritici TaxID=2851566 RepID=UPI001C2DB4B0|nr:HAD hydrolase-like protein [Catellatospora tritici]MBV1851890.1 HAD hydrolase-like protein [Catellatospora tritici]
MSDLEDVRPLLANADTVLLDFDGPVCSVFSGITDFDVASQLRQVLRDHGVAMPVAIERHNDPLEVLRFAAASERQVLVEVEERFVNAEVAAVKVAEPAPYAHDFIRAVWRAGKALAVVSNNSEPAIRAYLKIHGVDEYVGRVVGRAYADPARMKPHPHSVLRALSELDTVPHAAVLVGDSVTDVQVSVAVGVPCIGFANKPGKEQRLADAGAAAVATGADGMGLLVAALGTETA